jgi:molecular chaperone DnaK
MKQDAEVHAADDLKRKEVVEAKNLAEQMIYTAEKAIKDNGDKVDTEVVTEVNEKIAALKTAREGEDMDAIKSASEALSTSLSKIGEAMMKAQSENAASEAAPGTEANATEDSSTGAGATDAEFTEKPAE